MRPIRSEFEALQSMQRTPAPQWVRPAPIRAPQTRAPSVFVRLYRYVLTQH